jgi:hypothetical protein
MGMVQWLSFLQGPFQASLCLFSFATLVYVLLLEPALLSRSALLISSIEDAPAVSEIGMPCLLDPSTGRGTGAGGAGRGQRVQGCPAV